MRADLLNELQRLWRGHVGREVVQAHASLWIERWQLRHNQTTRVRAKATTATATTATTHTRTCLSTSPATESNSAKCTGARPHALPSSFRVQQPSHGESQPNDAPTHASTRHHCNSQSSTVNSQHSSTKTSEGTTWPHSTHATVAEDATHASRVMSAMEMRSAGFTRKILFNSSANHSTRSSATATQQHSNAAPHRAFRGLWELDRAFVCGPEEVVTVSTDGVEPPIIRRSALEGWEAAQHDEQHHAAAPLHSKDTRTHQRTRVCVVMLHCRRTHHISGATSVFLAGDQLWTHVARSTASSAQQGRGPISGTERGQTEICNLQVEVGADKNVLGLDVAVVHTQRVAVTQSCEQTTRKQDGVTCTPWQDKHDTAQPQQPS